MPTRSPVPARHALLDRVDAPADLRRLDVHDLPALADELRHCLIDTVSRTGGHLAAGLGVVELTVALHYVFDTPEDRLVWDVGHQAYPHKILTGLLDDTNRLLAEAGVHERHQHRTREAIFARRLAGWRLTRCWRLRPSPGTAFWSQLRIVGLLGNIASLIGAHTVEYLLWVLSWWMVGRAALAGRFDPGWLLARALVLLTLVPLRLFVFWSEGRVSIGAGGLLKQRLLFGALRLEPEEVRRAGAGQLLGRVIESEAVESLACTPRHTWT